MDCSDECKKPKYDSRVKWDGMRPQCSTWESCIQRIGLNLASKGVLDSYGTKVLVKDVVKRFGYLENNEDKADTAAAAAAAATVGLCAPLPAAAAAVAACVALANVSSLSPAPVTLSSPATSDTSALPSAPLPSPPNEN
jgi:hypothetical protein